jgi:hypothetical protein
MTSNSPPLRRRVNGTEECAPTLALGGNTTANDEDAFARLPDEIVACRAHRNATATMGIISRLGALSEQRRQHDMDLGAIDLWTCALASQTL